MGRRSASDWAREPSGGDEEGLEGIAEKEEKEERKYK